MKKIVLTVAILLAFIHSANAMIPKRCLKGHMGVNKQGYEEFICDQYEGEADKEDARHSGSDNKGNQAEGEKSMKKVLNETVNGIFSSVGLK